MVVYYLHGQTGRSTVWINGTQNSGLVNFVLESRLPFVKLSSIYRKTTANGGLSITHKWYRRQSPSQPFLGSSRNAPRGEELCVTSLKTAAKETISKMAFKKQEMNFRLKYSVWKNRTTFSPVAAGNFPLEQIKNSCSLYFPTEFSGNFLCTVRKQVTIINVHRSLVYISLPSLHDWYDCTTTTRTNVTFHRRRKRPTTHFLFVAF